MGRFAEANLKNILNIVKRCLLVLTPNSLQSLYDHRKEFEERLKEIIEDLSHRTLEPPHHRRIRRIFGENFLGLREVEKHLGLIPDPVREQLDDIPYTERTLRKYAENHILMAYTGYATHEMHMMNEDQLSIHPMIEGELPVMKSDQVSWVLISKDAYHESGGLLSDSQIVIVPTHRVPTTNELVYLMILWQQVTGNCMFDNPHGVRSNDTTQTGEPIDVRFNNNMVLVFPGKESNTASPVCQKPNL